MGQGLKIRLQKLEAAASLTKPALAGWQVTRLLGDLESGRRQFVDLGDDELQAVLEHFRRVDPKGSRALSLASDEQLRAIAAGASPASVGVTV